jgi:hypothetical protein
MRPAMTCYSNLIITTTTATANMFEITMRESKWKIFNLNKTLEENKINKRRKLKKSSHFGRQTLFE